MPVTSINPAFAPGFYLQKGADKEFILVVQVTNENLSWYIDENIKKRIKDMSKVNKTDPAFVESNRMRSKFSSI